MTTYRAIASTEVDPDSPVTATLMEALTDNPTAISEGASGAPYLGSAPHPYDGVTVGDGNDGLLYDFAVDGAVASVQTPNFESGYKYTIRVVNSSHAVASNQDLEIEWFETGPTLLGTSTLVAAAVSAVTAGRASADMYADDFSLSFPSTIASQAVRPVLYGVVQYSLGANFDAGKIYMFRELDYSALL